MLKGKSVGNDYHFSLNQKFHQDIQLSPIDWGNC